METKKIKPTDYIKWNTHRKSWLFLCPVCGKKFELENKHDRIICCQVIWKLDVQAKGEEIIKKEATGIETKEVPFDKERAKKGDKVITRDGRDAKFVGEEDHKNYPLAFNVEGYLYCYTEKGHIFKDEENPLDLFMAEEELKRGDKVFVWDVGSEKIKRPLCELPTHAKGDGMGFMGQSSF